MNTPKKVQWVYFEHDNSTFLYFSPLDNENPTTRRNLPSFGKVETGVARRRACVPPPDQASKEERI